MNRKEFIKVIGAAAGAAAFPKAKVEQNGLALYGHVAQNEPPVADQSVFTNFVR